MGRGSATWRSVADRRHDDDGVSLIEVMVALGLLVVLGAGVASSLLVIQKSAFTSKQRSAAANLATREVEVVRNWFHSSDTAPARRHGGRRHHQRQPAARVRPARSWSTTSRTPSRAPSTGWSRVRVRAPATAAPS